MRQLVIVDADARIDDLYDAIRVGARDLDAYAVATGNGRIDVFDAVADEIDDRLFELLCGPADISVAFDGCGQFDAFRLCEHADVFDDRFDERTYVDLLLNAFAHRCVGAREPDEVFHHVPHILRERHTDLGVLVARVALQHERHVRLDRRYGRLQAVRDVREHVVMRRRCLPRPYPALHHSF